MDNVLAQSEELFVLKSIYDEKDLIWNDSETPCGRYVANIQLCHPFYIICFHDETENDEINKNTNSKFEKIDIDYLPPVNLTFELPETYPSTTCPAFLLSCNWLTINQLSKLCQHLEFLWEEGNGEVVLFRWIQFLQEETLQFLEINDVLDITEISKCNLETNFLNMIQNSSDFSCSSRKSISNVESEDIQKMTSDFDRIALDVDLNKRQPHIKVDSNVTHLNLALGDLKPSISGGPEVNDKRAFLDLPNGRTLLKQILDFDNYKKHEHFQITLHACKICYLDKKGYDFVKFKGCNHTYCKECLQSYFEVQIKEGNVHLLNCPEERCLSQADGTLVKQLVRTDLFDKYDSLLLSRTLESMPDVAYCPRQSCQCPLLIDSAGRIGTCPACSYVFCPYCKMAYHGVAPCNFKTEQKQRIYREYKDSNAQEKRDLEKRYGKRILQALVDDTLSENWVQSFSKSCPQCNASIEKNDGCNKMTCFRCGTYFCWLCMSPLKINPYSHFSDQKSPCYGQLLPDEYFDEAFDVEPGEFLDLNY